MSDRVSGSERFVAALRQAKALPVLINSVQEKLDSPATVRDLIDILYEQVEVNTRLGAVVVALQDDDRARTLELTQSVLESLSTQAESLTRLFEKVTSGLETAAERLGDGNE